MGRTGYDLSLMRDALAALEQLDIEGRYQGLRKEMREATDPWLEIQEGRGLYPPYIEKDPVAAMKVAAERGLKLLTEFWTSGKTRELHVLHYWVKA